MRQTTYLKRAGATAVLLAAALQTCGCSGHLDGTWQIATTPGNVAGRVTDAAGNRIAGATVTVGAQEVQTDNSGDYRVTGLAPTLIGVSAGKLGYIGQTRSVSVPSGSTATVNFTLAAVATSVTVAAAASEPQTVTDTRVDDLGVQASFEAGSLVDVNGVPLAGPVTVQLTTLLPSEPAFAAALPGSLPSMAPGYDIPSTLVVFAAFSLLVADAEGNQVYIDPMKPLSVAIPVSPDNDPRSSTMGLWMLDPESGYWTQMTTVTRDGSVAPVVYRGQLGAVSRSRMRVNPPFFNPPPGGGGPGPGRSFTGVLARPYEM